MQHLRLAAQAVEDDLAQLGAVASARRRGEHLVALSAGAHSACLERLIALGPDIEQLESDAEIAEVLRVHRPSPPDADPLDGFAERIDATLAAIEQTGMPGLPDAAARLLDTMSDIYGAAMARTLELLHQAGHGDAIRAALDDELVSSAMVVHGLHPDDVETRARAAVETVNQTLSDVGPHAVLSRVEPDGTVRLRIEGEPVRDRWRVAVAVERAVQDAAPDAAGVIVDGVSGDGVSGRDVEGDAPGPTEVFIPLSSIERRSKRVPSRWIEVPDLARLAPGEVARISHEELSLLACRIGDDLYVAVDPFDDDRLQLHATGPGPPSVSSSTGATFVFTDPLTVHHDGDLVEVAVP